MGQRGSENKEMQRSMVEYSHMERQGKDAAD